MAYWVGLVCMLLGAVGKYRASELEWKNGGGGGGGGAVRVCQIKHQCCQKLH